MAKAQGVEVDSSYPQGMVKYELTADAPWFVRKGEYIMVHPEVDSSYPQGMVKYELTADAPWFVLKGEPWDIYLK